LVERRRRWTGVGWGAGGVRLRKFDGVCLSGGGRRIRYLIRYNNYHR
jgi:hypothetical protein